MATGIDRRSGPHRRGDEAASPEAGQLVPIAVQLAGALGALREHEQQLAVVAQDPQRVLRMGDDASGARQQHSQSWHRGQSVVVQAVHRPVQLTLDPVHHQRGIDRDQPGVIGHQHRPALSRDPIQVLEAEAKPVPVQRLRQCPQHCPRPFRTAPSIDTVTLVDADPASAVGHARRAMTVAARSEPRGGQAPGDR